GWIVEYVATMGRRHDRLAWLEKTLKEPPLAPPRFYPKNQYLQSLRYWIVSGLVSGGAGADWASAEAVPILRMILEQDSSDGLSLLLVNLARHPDKGPR